MNIVNVLTGRHGINSPHYMEAQRRGEPWASTCRGWQWPQTPTKHLPVAASPRCPQSQGCELQFPQWPLGASLGGAQLTGCQPQCSGGSPSSANRCPPVQAGSVSRAQADPPCPQGANGSAWEAGLWLAEAMTNQNRGRQQPGTGSWLGWWLGNSWYGRTSAHPPTFSWVPALMRLTAMGHLSTLNRLPACACGIWGLKRVLQVQTVPATHLGRHIYRTHPPPEHYRKADDGREAGCGRSCFESTRVPSCRWGPNHRWHSYSHT